MANTRKCIQCCELYETPYTTNEELIKLQMFRNLLCVTCSNYRIPSRDIVRCMGIIKLSSNFSSWLSPTQTTEAQCSNLTLSNGCYTHVSWNELTFKQCIQVKASAGVDIDKYSAYNKCNLCEEYCHSKSLGHTIINPSPDMPSLATSVRLCVNCALDNIDKVVPSPKPMTYRPLLIN